MAQESSHRPWPVPSAPWVMFQSWRDLLFAHWPIPTEVLRPLVPAELELDEFDGSAWLGLTPFRLSGLRLRLLPAVPGISTFPEMNLRTYVRPKDKPGIFFFSLDAANALAVLGARLGYALPYFNASMRMRAEGDWTHYSSRRSGGDAEFVGRYRPVGPPFRASPGSLEYFLVERYALYTVPRTGRVVIGEIDHPPWELHAAEAVIERNTVPAAHGITLPRDEPLLHFSARQDTRIWPPGLLK